MCISGVRIRQDAAAAADPKAYGPDAVTPLELYWYLKRSSTSKQTQEHIRTSIGKNTNIICMYAYIIIFNSIIFYMNAYAVVK